MVAINYVVGDATEPQAKGPKFIAHVVNDVGAWGAGFTQSISKKWPEAERSYRDWHADKDCTDQWGAERFQLGAVRYTIVGDGMLVRPKGAIEGITVVHMVAQQGLRRKDYRRPLRYDALGACLILLGRAAASGGYTVHMPRIGCGLAGGDWMYVEKILEDAMGNCEAYVYDLPL